MIYKIEVMDHTGRALPLRGFIALCSIDGEELAGIRPGLGAWVLSLSEAWARGGPAVACVSAPRSPPHQLADSDVRLPHRRP